jgi:sortase B
MGAAALGKSVIRLANNLLDTAVLIAALLILSVALYALWDSDSVYGEADSANYASYKPAADALSFEELKTINPEVFAWLTVYGTHIDYPVVQGEDNMKYVSTNAKGNYALSGAIFLDSGSKSDFSDFGSILYGHHMEKNAMFGNLGLFTDRSFFDTRAYGSLYYDGREHGLEFFAFLHIDAYDGRIFRSGITDPGESRDYLALLLESAVYTRDIGVTEEDRIVLLATCSSGFTNGRYILAGRISDDIYEDGFKTTEGMRIPGADRLISLWGLIPPWLVLALGLMLLLASALLLMREMKRK